MTPLAIMTGQALPLNLGVRLPHADRARDTITTISWSARILCSDPITDGIKIATKVSTLSANVFVPRVRAESHHGVFAVVLSMLFDHVHGDHVL